MDLKPLCFHDHMLHPALSHPTARMGLSLNTKVEFNFLHKSYQNAKLKGNIFE